MQTYANIHTDAQMGGRSDVRYLECRVRQIQVALFVLVKGDFLSKQPAIDHDKVKTYILLSPSPTIPPFRSPCLTDVK